MTFETFITSLIVCLIVAPIIVKLVWYTNYTKLYYKVRGIK